MHTNTTSETLCTIKLLICNVYDGGAGGSTYLRPHAMVVVTARHLYPVG
jgi:hypothetical protein